MKLAKFIAASLGLAVVSYLVVGFISWQWNPEEWSRAVRGMAVYCWLVGTFASGGILSSL